MPPSSSLIPGQYPDGHWQRYAGAVRSPTGESPIVWTAEAVLALQAMVFPPAPGRIAGTRDPRVLPGYKGQTAQHLSDMLCNCLHSMRQALRKIKSKMWRICCCTSNETMADGEATRSCQRRAFYRLSPATRCGRAGSSYASGVAHRRGVQYLLSTQYPDGSWYVRSRAAGFQPYFESGFPFKHDQWISAAATGWAAEALARSIEYPIAATDGVKPCDGMPALETFLRTDRSRLTLGLYLE